MDVDNYRVLLVNFANITVCLEVEIVNSFTVDLTMYWYMDLYVVENDIVYNISVGVRAGLFLKWHYDEM